MSYIGPSEILDTKDAGFKSPLGYEVLEVTFKDGFKTLMTKKYVDKMSDEQPVNDYTALREKQTKMIVGEMLAVLYEWGIKQEDVRYTLDKVAQSINENLDETDAHLYGIDKVYNRNLMHLYKVLLDKNAQHREDDNSKPDPAS